MEYDNSHEGNDCWVNEHWIWSRAFNVAIKLTQVNGWGDTDLCTQTYEEPNEKMPQDVRDWFKGD